MLALFAASLLIQLYFTIFIHWKLRGFSPVSAGIRPPVPVSVIICARNEEANLRRHLPAILEQDYPYFEVVVVNDCSYDDTHLLLKELGSRYPNLKIVTIAEHERYKHGKKFAVTLGIKAASHDILLFTDADCRPASPAWVGQVAANFEAGTEIVLGYSPYERLPGWLNKLIRFETFYTALSYLSCALCGNPYMGVGRNLAYRKELFFRGKGFASHMHIPSGDDDLFVNQNATATNTAIEISQDAQLISIPKTTFRAYSEQKIRHYGAGKAYKTRHKRLITLQFASALAFYLPAIALFFIQPAWWPWFLGAIVFRWIVQWIAYIPVFRKLSCSDLAPWLPVLDIFYYFYQTSFSLKTLFRKKVQWK
jgi:glycosyltransferase involved in cell wall biosynthesis